jgi:transcriptional regulator with XRE-family HTH domain
LAAIEQGRYSPSLETAFRIAREFDAGLKDIFSWVEQFLLLNIVNAHIKMTILRPIIQLPAPYFAGQQFAIVY